MISAAAVPNGNVDALATLLTSPATGIVRRLGLHPAPSGNEGFYAAYAELADARALGCFGEIQTPGGSGFSEQEAVTRALFEAVERYCGAFVDRQTEIWGPAPQSALDLPMYTEEQYQLPAWPYSRLSRDSQLWWTPATCLHTGARRYIPSSLVHIPDMPKHREECLGPSISTGMAANWTWDAACLSGLYEVCERDAFATMWAKRQTGPRLLPAPASRLKKETSQVTASGRATVTYVDISNDLGVPTVLAVLRQTHRDRPIVAIGSAAKSCFEAACRKALAEAVSIRGALVESLDGPDAAWMPNEDFSNVTDWKWHALVYTLPEFEPALDFLTASPDAYTIAEAAGPGPDLRTVAASLEPHFPQLVAVDLTTPEFAELRVRAVKVVAPHALPVEPDHRYRRLALPRLQACGPTRDHLPHPFL